jgi:hypothetical protein
VTNSPETARDDDVSEASPVVPDPAADGPDALLAPGRTSTGGRPTRFFGVQHGHPAVALACAGLALVGVASPAPSVRLVPVMVFTLLGPGCGLLSWVPVRKGFVSWTLAITASLTTITLVPTLMLWTGKWQPLVAHLGLIAATAVAGLLRLVRERRRIEVPTQDEIDGSTTSAVSAADDASTAEAAGSARRWAAPLLLAVALVGWAWSLTTFRIDRVDYFGLTFALGLPFVVAVVAVALALALEFFGSARTSVLVAASLVLVLIAKGSAPLLLHLPQYPWTYKHIGVVELFRRSGRVVDSHDLYQQWPAFFAAAAHLTDISHVSAVTLARWAPLFFTTVQMVLVAGLARTTTGDRRTAVAAAVLFAACSAPETNYFSPQALAFTLFLGFMVLLTSWLRDAPTVSHRAAPWFTRVRLVIYRGLPAAFPTEPRQRTGALVAGALVFMAVTWTHQLTPFIGVASVGAVTALGLVRPRYLVAVLIALTAVYVIPRTSVIGQYQLFTGFDVLKNAGGNVQDGWATSGQAFSALTVRGLAIVIWVSSLFAAWSRRRHLGTVIFALTMAFTPFVFLVGGNYGGELIYRVYVFSLPWCALILAQTASAKVDRLKHPRRHRRRALPPALGRHVLPAGIGGAALAVLLLAALQGTEGQFAFDHVSQESVSAAEFFYDEAPPGSALVLGTSDFPGRISARYRLFNQGLPAEPTLTDQPLFQHRRLDDSQLPAVTDFVRSIPGTGHYLAVSDAMAVEAGYFGRFPDGSLTALTGALRRSADWSVFYENPQVVIFRLN